jgi:hypothetical protein
MALRMLSFTIGRVGEPDRRWFDGTGRAIVANVGPEPSGLRLAGTGCEHGHRRVIAVELACRQHMTTQGFDQRSQQGTALTDPPGKRRTVQLHPLPGVDRRLTIERQVIAELGREDMGEKARAGHAAGDGSRRCRRLHDAIACCATHPWTDMANDLEAGGQVLQHLGDIFAKLLELALADRAALLLRKVLMHFARQVFGKSPFLPGSGPAICR